MTIDIPTGKRRMCVSVGDDGVQRDYAHSGSMSGSKAWSWSSATESSDSDPAKSSLSSAEELFAEEAEEARERVVRRCDMFAEREWTHPGQRVFICLELYGESAVSATNSESFGAYLTNLVRRGGQTLSTP